MVGPCPKFCIHGHQFFSVRFPSSPGYGENDVPWDVLAIHELYPMYPHYHLVIKHGCENPELDY